MRIPWRAAAGAVLVATTLVPATPAPASDTVWICTYYKYDHGSERWVRVETLADSDWYEGQPGHAQYESWDCKYCYVPAGTTTLGRNGGLPLPGRADEIRPPGGTVVDTNAVGQGSGRGPVDDALAALHDALPGELTAVLDPVVDQARTALGPILPPQPCPLVPPEDPGLP
jgi:hypothetical protein